MKNYTILFLMSFLSIYIHGQDESQPLISDMNYSPIQNFQAPNVATFNTYGNIPVDLHTGAPNISIPIYNIVENGISIPIGLRYNIHNVKPNTHPGVVGLGWNVMVGGNITRTQQGQPDEYDILDSFNLNTYKKYGYLGQECRLSDSWAASSCYPFYSMADAESLKSAWSSTTRMHLDAKHNDAPYSLLNPKYDMTPDKFSFNFLNYSGAFYRDHTGKWVVDSETPFRVEYRIGYLSNTRKQISVPLNNMHSYIANQKYREGKTLMEFVLTAPDGIKYYFGEDYAIDYSISYFDQGTVLNPPIATTWHLTKIVFPNAKRPITFNYQPTDPMIDINYSFLMLPDHDYRLGSSSPRARNFNVQLLMSVLLESIEIEGFPNLVKFRYGKSVALEYPLRYFCRPVSGSQSGVECHGESIDLNSSHFYTPSLPDMGREHMFHYISKWSDIAWNKLEEITINASQPVSYVFGYTESKLERLKLLSINRSANSGKLSEKHTFLYNSKKLPAYISGHYDHLGFYNGKDFSYTLDPNFFDMPRSREDRLTKIRELSAKFKNSREGDRSGEYVCAEMLTQMNYPTGGYTVFEYEPNQVTQVVTVDRSSTEHHHDDLPYYPGGLRIKSIKDYTQAGQVAQIKQYYYVKDFNLKTQTGSPSGVLGFNPLYYWYLYVLKSSEPTHLYQELEIFSSGSTSQAYYNLNAGVYVGYSEVIESKMKGAQGTTLEFEGYTRYKYRNYEEGFFDSKPIQNMGYKPNSYAVSPYTPFTSNAKKRGKILLKEIYDKDNKLVKGQYYDYLTNLKAQVRNLNVHLIKIEPKNTWGYLLGGSYYINIEDYQLGRIREKTIVNSDTIRLDTEYRYNTEGSVILERKTFNNNENYETKQKYTGDLFRENDGVIASYPYGYMFNKNLLKSPVETVVLKNGKVISSQVLDYTISSSTEYTNPYPFKVYKLETSVPVSDYQYAKIPKELGKPLLIDTRNTLELESTTLNQYGNTNYIKTDNQEIFYLWSYQGRYVVAEIKGASELTVMLTLNDIDLTPEIISNWTIPDMKKLEYLRERMYNGAEVTTYTYKPLVGVSSMTDPRGITTYYDYDGFGRLSETYRIENGSRNMIQKYDYNYMK